MAGSPSHSDHKHTAFFPAERQKRTRNSPSPQQTVMEGLRGVLQQPASLWKSLQLCFFPSKRVCAGERYLTGSSGNRGISPASTHSTARVHAELPPCVPQHFSYGLLQGAAAGLSSPSPAPQAVLAGLLLFVMISRSGKQPANMNKNFVIGKTSSGTNVLLLLSPNEPGNRCFR